MSQTYPKNTVFVSQSSVESDDNYDIIYSNIIFTNTLFENYVKDDEISEDALRSYYVDFYLSQVLNGGFSQFVYNSSWDDNVNRLVASGLQAMQATKHYELFKKAQELVNKIGVDKLDEFLSSEYFGENAERDFLNSLDDTFYHLNDTEEDLIIYNVNWLKNLPNLVILDDEQLELQIQAITAAIPNPEERRKAAQENAPLYWKLIMKLCELSGQQLDRITAGDPTHQHNGDEILAWHFLTNTGHFLMLQLTDTAYMFEYNESIDDTGTQTAIASVLIDAVI